MASYKILSLDLTLVGDRKEIVQRNTRVGNVAIMAFPAGAIMSLHFGQQEGIPITGAGIDFRPCPPENDGVFISNPAQPGTTVTLLVGLGDEGPGVSVT